MSKVYFFFDGVTLRWFPSFVSRIPTAHDFRVIIERAHMSACTYKAQEISLLQTKLHCEINAPVLLNKHDDPYFLFFKLIENNILNQTEKKIDRNLWLLFWQMK